MESERVGCDWVFIHTITSTEIKTVIKKKKKKILQQTKAQGQMASQVNSIKCIERIKQPILLKLIQNIAEEETLQNSLFEVTITLTPEPDKDITQKINK